MKMQRGERSTIGSCKLAWYQQVERGGVPVHVRFLNDRRARYPRGGREKNVKSSSELYVCLN